MKKTTLLLLTVLLAACGGPTHEERLAQLAELERMNRADSVMTNDTLAEALVSYFDDHGTDNERMRARYILGRTYADMGELPRAIEAYLDAASCADTLSADCDYYSLSRVYGQMSGIFFLQNLTDIYLQNADKSIACAWKAGDTLQALNETALKVAAYDQFRQYDTAAALFDSVFVQLCTSYGIGTAAKYCGLPLKSLIETGNYEKARYYIALYDSASGYVDHNGNVESGREVYYYYKGMYYMAAGQYDSARFFFNKELREGHDVNNQNMASKGLAQVYGKTQKPDSAAKYALYSYAMNDSVYRMMVIREVEQAQAAFNYSRQKEKADKESRRAEREKERNRWTLALLGLLAVAATAIFISLRKKRKKAESAYYQKQEELGRAIETMLVLRTEEERLAHIIDMDKEAIQTKDVELDGLREQEILLKQLVEEKEKEVKDLRESMSQLKTWHRNDSVGVETRLQSMPQYASLCKHAVQGKLLRRTELQQAYLLVAEALPGFHEFISTQKHALNRSEYNVCMLFRLQFNATSVAMMLGLSASAVTKISKSLMQKLFKAQGNSKELIKCLADIC